MFLDDYIPTSGKLHYPIKDMMLFHLSNDLGSGYWQRKALPEIKNCAHV